jgi:hypothetical protein
LGTYFLQENFQPLLLEVRNFEDFPPYNMPFKKFHHGRGHHIRGRFLAFTRVGDERGERKGVFKEITQVERLGCDYQGKIAAFF